MASEPFDVPPPMKQQRWPESGYAITTPRDTAQMGDALSYPMDHEDMCIPVAVVSQILTKPDGVWNQTGIPVYLIVLLIGAYYVS